MPASNTPALSLRVELAHIEPRIWREVTVPTNVTLEHLHDVLQIVMGWENRHLYEFRVGSRSYLSQHAVETLMQRGEDRPESTQLAELHLKSGDEFEYVYDFGDYWEHRIRVLAQIKPDDATRHARCSGGQGVCPPEDCGGLPAYMELQRLGKVPAHAECDIVGINRLLQKRR